MGLPSLSLTHRSFIRRSVVNKQASFTVYRRQPYAGAPKTLQLHYRRADECMVENYPRFVCKLKIPITLYQYSLPVTQLRFYRDEPVERWDFHRKKF